MSCLAAVWYSDLKLLASAQLARVAVGKQQFVHVTSWNRYILLGSGSCKVTWLFVLLNKGEWVWVGGVGCRGWTKRDLIVMAVCRSNLTLSLYLSSSHAVVCVFFLARAGERGGGFSVYLPCANQHWTSQLEKLDQTLPITRLTRDVSFHLSFTGLWNHEAEWKIQAATNHCRAGSLWRSTLRVAYIDRIGLTAWLCTQIFHLVISLILAENNTRRKWVPETTCRKSTIGLAICSLGWTEISHKLW